MKKINIIITAYLGILLFSNTACGDLTIGKECIVLDSLEAEIIGQIKELQTKGINATDNQGRTPLFIAAQHNQVQIIKELLQNKDIEIDKADNDGLTPLAIAINEQNLEAVHALLHSNSKRPSQIANVETRDKRIGYTPLARAALSGKEQIIKLLLQAGANPTTLVKREDKIISVSDLYKLDNKETKELLEKAAEEFSDRGLEALAVLSTTYNSIKKYNKVKALFDLGIDVAVEDDYGNTLLHWVCSSLCGYQDIAKLLIDSKVDVNATNYLGCTALLYAVRPGHENIVKLLIDNKSDVNVSNRDGHTPLYEAVFHRNKSMVELLITAGADVKTAFGDKTFNYREAKHKSHKDILDILKKAGAKVEESRSCIIC